MESAVFKNTSLVVFAFIVVFVLIVVFALIVLLVSIPNTNAASSTVFGSTDAVKCYEDSRLTPSVESIITCSNAIMNGNLGKRDLAATYSNRGLIYAKNRHFDKALDDHNKAIQLKPDLMEVYINRGNAYYMMSEYDKAMKNYEKAVALGEGPTQIAHYNMGMIFLKYKDIPSARNAFLKALEIVPKSSAIRERLDLIGDTD